MANVEQRQHDPVEAIVEAVSKGVSQALRIGYVGAKPVGEAMTDMGIIFFQPRLARSKHFRWFTYLTADRYQEARRRRSV